jgi:hypothetical protein
MIAPDLRSWGITQFDVAEQAIRQSMELFESHQHDATFEVAREDGIRKMLRTPQGMGRAMMTSANLLDDPYVVDEPNEPYNLSRWRPPNRPGDFPKRWYARAPANVNSYRPTELCGWRTNLERAILREDAPTRP